MRRLSVALADLRPGEGRRVVVDERPLALFLTAGGEVLAVDARCPHAGGPLEDGIVSGDTVTCPLHLRRVGLRTGEVEDCPTRVRSYPVEVVGGEVLIEL